MSEQEPTIQLPTEKEVAEFGGTPTTPESPSAAVVESGADLAKQLEETRDKLLRARAELQNVQKRFAAERLELARYAITDLARAMLNVLSDLERTLEAGSKAADVGAVLDGVKLVRDNFVKALADQKITPIEAVGKPFDPAVHSAVMQQPSEDHLPGMVIQELERGYRMHDRVLRPSKVIVARAPETLATEE